MKRTGVIVVLFLGIALTQYGYDARKPPAGFAPLVVFPPAVLRSADLGLDSAVASLIWLNAIQEIGTIDGSYEGLVGDIETINALDPRFAYPYAFAELVIPWLDPSKTLDAIAIGARGVERVRDWRIPFYLASAYAIHLNDRENAVKYFDIAAHTPGIPKAIQGTALNFGTQKDKRAQTRAIWTSIYESTDDEILKSQAQANIAHIEILDVLERAVLLYKKEKGIYPKQMEDMVNAGILKEIPQDPLGFTYTLDEDGTLASHL